MSTDLELARRFVAEYAAPGTMLCCAVTGSHMYGFASADSDLDIKGIHIAPTRSLLGLRRDQRSAAHDTTENFEGVEFDFTTNEAGEALAILLSGNGSVLERILSPLQIVEHPNLAELQAITKRSLSQRFAKHYVGFFHGCRRDFLRTSTLKGLLSAYRVGLTGLTMLDTGDVETNLLVLAQKCGFDGVEELVARIRVELPGGVADRFLVEQHESALERLQTQLVASEARSQLPPHSTNADELNDWLVERRLECIDPH